MWYHLSKIGIFKKNAGERRTSHPKRPSHRDDHLVWGYPLFFLRRDADPATAPNIARFISGSQPFSDLDTIDDPYPTDNRRDGVLYCCL